MSSGWLGNGVCGRPHISQWTRRFVTRCRLGNGVGRGGGSLGAGFVVVSSLWLGLSSCWYAYNTVAHRRDLIEFHPYAKPVSVVFHQLCVLLYRYAAPVVVVFVEISHQICYHSIFSCSVPFLATSPHDLLICIVLVLSYAPDLRCELLLCLHTLVVECCGYFCLKALQRCCWCWWCCRFRSLLFLSHGDSRRLLTEDR